MNTVSDKEMVKLAVAGAKRARKPNWVFIAEHGVGSTKAYEICRELGVDPESIEFKRKEIRDDNS